jgi:hypothetical protein
MGGQFNLNVIANRIDQENPVNDDGIATADIHVGIFGDHLENIILGLPA